MARPKKQGLDYFPLDVDLDYDDKLAMLIGEFGCKGELIWIKFLSYLYKNYGYFIPWDEVEQLKFAKRVAYIGASANLINEVVVRCVKWGLLDETVFNATRAATSVRIQKTWLEVSRKRKDREINPEIWLLSEELPAEKTELIPEETGFRRKSRQKPPLIPEETTQSKVNYKEEINKEEGLPNQEATFWERERTAFLTNQLFFEKFCMARRLPPDVVRRLQEYFVEGIELKSEIKEASEIQRHFVNWFDKSQRDGVIDQYGIHKNAPASPGSITVRNAREQKANSILDQFD